MLMGDIMSLAPKFRTDLEPRVFSHSGVTLYRGSTQSHSQIEELKFAACPDVHPQTGIPINRNRDTDENGNIIALNLHGFISTSVDREFAEKNAYRDDAGGTVAALFVMDFRDNGDYWVMNQGSFD